MLQSLKVEHSIKILRSSTAIPRTGTCALICSAHGIPSYNQVHNASVRSTTVLPLGEWPRLERLPLSQDICPFPVRSISQLWIGKYIHIPAVALVTVRFRCYSKAASIGEMFSTRLHVFWANSCFLASLTLLRSLVLLYVSKTKRCIISTVLSLKGFSYVQFLHMLQ